MKKIIILITVVVGMIILFRSLAIKKIDSIESNISSPAVESSAKTEVQPEKKIGSLPLPSQSEVEKCLGKPASDIQGFYNLGIEKLGPIKGESLNWKSIFFEDGEKHFRLSLESQVKPSGKEFVELKLFELDHDNLPDLVRIPKNMSTNPSEESIQSFLQGKRITKIQQSKELEFEEGLMQVETEDDSLREVRFESKNIRIGCGVAFEASCKCSIN